MEDVGAAANRCIGILYSGSLGFWSRSKVVFFVWTFVFVHVNGSAVVDGHGMAMGPGHG